MAYVIRVQDATGYEEKIDTHLPAEVYPKVLAVRHTGRSEDNPHFHIIIEEYEHSMQNLRKQLKLVFDEGEGNQHMSLKKFDQNKKGYAYMFHEMDRDSFRVVASRGHSIADILSYKNHHQAVLTQISNNTPHKICDKVVQVLRTAQPQRGRFEKSEICKEIWLHCKAQGDWQPNRFQLQRWVQRIEMLCTKSERDWDLVMEMWFYDAYPNHTWMN